ncbi:MAG: ThiF family adenylyltransferase [Anaerolineae bacterium]|nr:ThiF family adenylyltransferase [Anaerolineae bacterium]
MTWDRIAGKLGKDNLALLAEKRVGIVGLGSGGSFVALSLAMSGVGHFVLIDPDVLEAGNVVRHAADLRDVGKPKVTAVAELIHQRAPNAVVETRIGRIEANLDALDHLDVLIVGVDGEGPKYVINQACLARDLTAIYAGVYERGEGGDVCIIQPYVGPCYACWAAELREGLVDPRADVELDYGMIGADGTLEAEPGLWLDVVRVAAAQADMALSYLLRATDARKPLPGNTIILANNMLEIAEGHHLLPFSAEWVQIERDPHCLVCGDAVRADRLQEQQPELSLDDLMQEAGISLETPEEEEQSS